jgi:hypothetical protein
MNHNGTLGYHIKLRVFFVKISEDYIAFLDRFCICYIKS